MKMKGHYFQRMTTAKDGAQTDEERVQTRVKLIRELLKRVEEVHTAALELAIDAGIVEALASGSKVIEPYFIIDLVQRKLGISVTSKDRKRETVEARQVAIYLLRKYCRISLMRIAQYVALTDHSGVLHHLKQIEGFIKVDDRVAALITAFEEDILEYFEKNTNDGNGI